MLKQLTIQNYALISKLEIDFSRGMSAMTGETGAGKSIIIGALSLILGQRADAKSIKQDEDKCLIEGLFDISSYNLESFFIERDLEYDAHNCLLRREIWRSGKSRAFINDTPAGLNDLKDLGAFLIDIHSQHQNLLLADNKFQLQVVDVMANNQSLRETYQTAYRHFLSVRKQLQELTEKARIHSSEQEYLRFQFQQLDEARLQPGEQAELENEAGMLSHIEEIKNGMYAVEHLLSSDDKGIIVSLKEALNAMQSIHKLYPAAGGMVERLQTAYLDLKDMLPDIVNRQEKLELDPERLQWVHRRLDLLYSLQQKHKMTSVEELIALHDNLKIQLQEIENYDEAIAGYHQELENAEKNVLHLARELTKTRAQAAAHLEQQLVEQVSALGMPFMQFTCSIAAKNAPDTTGIDDVSFLFSANRNVPVKPVAQTASGGEISRLMLGIKALIAGILALPTIIFDEIDTGVSGEVADKMGKIMHEMGEIMQVIAITHLPQIAARGDFQYFVYKEENDVTETHIRRLSPEERIKEIAQMLSGSELTDAAIANAKELLR
ncbi:MAG: DNA repair protein RecN [Dysgonamonadaceae bacterium]|jgi:DNA repair protein RecN (Recombination protein N)|nr:DNA repair protein RecN [Dysgonamonadaceae bacterium]